MLYKLGSYGLSTGYVATQPAYRVLLVFFFGVVSSLFIELSGAPQGYVSGPLSFNI
jgi:hypothetical protein